jgi:hypothetical protein
MLPDRLGENFPLLAWTWWGSIILLPQQQTRASAEKTAREPAW